MAPPLVPEIRLHLATAVTPLWEATEATLEREGVPPPYWAFAWVGGQALARYVLDHGAALSGRRVLDLAAGCGIAAIAAAMHGAQADAADIDAFARAAARVNAEANGVSIGEVADDLLAAPPSSLQWDAILAGDVCYEKPMTERMMRLLRRAAGEGRTVWLADPGRSYLPKDGLEELARYVVPCTRDLEDADQKTVRIFRVVP
ncbi:MAG: class I SAM-dependent methyltransferase [Gemmatimonas sp.]